MKNLCPNKEVCGSCSWSNMAYKEQLIKKLYGINSEFINNQLDYNCKDIIPSPKEAHYRNKMDFVINYQGLFGLREKGKWWRVIDDHTCFLALEPIEETFHKIYKWVKNTKLSYYDRKAKAGILRYAVIRATQSGDVLVNIITSNPVNASEKSLILKELSFLAKNLTNTSVVWAINKTDTDISYGTELLTISGEGYLVEEINNIKYKVTPNAFFQTNPFTAKLLQDEVIKIIKDVKPNKILDAYCGSGFFSLAASAHSEEVHGIEEVQEAIEDAEYNKNLNNISNCFFEAKKFEDFDWGEKNPDLLILDPPRAGLHKKVLEKISENKPKHIIYVSCNYKSFGREMVELKQLYKVNFMRAVDMFPQTPHVELLTHLALK